MNIIDFLADWPLALGLLGLVTLFWATRNQLIDRHHFEAGMAAVFFGLAYLAMHEENWTGCALDCAFGLHQALLYRRHRPRAVPLDGSHEAL